MNLFFFFIYIVVVSFKWVCILSFIKDMGNILEEEVERV